MNLHTKLLAILFVLISFSCYSQTNPKQATLQVDKKTNCSLRYYYYPNLQCYFDLKEKMYVYRINNEWVKTEELPENFGGYSIYKDIRVLIEDYDGETPYELLPLHKKRFPYSKNGKIRIALDE